MLKGQIQSKGAEECTMIAKRRAGLFQRCLFVDCAIVIGQNEIAYPIIKTLLKTSSQYQFTTVQTTRLSCQQKGNKIGMLFSIIIKESGI